ncbi:MAG: CxxxxCH/CxxCH domain-containing protein [Nitrospirae bacterium]|nr:CxxxxCH/CxxCH domain-containing protein [Nitrospirota bacterium]
MFICVSELYASGDVNLLRRSPGETCEGCHRTNDNTPSPGEVGFDQNKWDKSIKMHSSEIAGYCSNSTYKTKTVCVSNGAVWTPRKWTGNNGWGVAGGQYGEFVCTTCHASHNTKNIYLIKENIAAPSDTFPGAAVNFRYVTGAAGNALYVMGDDSENHTSSIRVCEVCHSLTNYHRYNTNAQPNKSHNNALNCVTCHSHSTGFCACNTCHGASGSSGAPLITGDLVTGENATGSLYAGKHQRHVADLGYACETCHTGYLMPDNVNHSIDIGFSVFSINGGSYDGQTTANYYASGANTSVTNNGSMRCGNIYCHSNGTSVSSGTIPAYASASWGTGSVTCSSCHGAPPNYTNTYPKANSHSRHSYITCKKCHWNTTNTGNDISDYSKHVNGSYDIGNSTGTLTYNYSASGGSCSGTFGCHGSATWGGTLPAQDYSNCVSCHKSTKGSRRQIVDSNGDGSGTGGDFKKTSHHVLSQFTSTVPGQVTVNSPSSTTTGTGGFTDPENANSLDGNYATCTVNDNTQFYSNYGISLMGDSQDVTKVEVGVAGYYTADTVRTSRLYLQVSWDDGTTWGTEQYVVLPRNTASTQYKNFTSNTAWTAAKLSNLKVRVRNYFTSTPATTNNLDWLSVRVTYDYSMTITTPIGNAACLICHDVTLHLSGTVRLKDADSPGTVYAYDPANPATTELFCLSCHDANGAGGNYSPFSDGATLGAIPYMAGKDIKTYWTKTYGHKERGLTCLGNGDPNTGCHSNGHGSDYKGLLAKNLALPLTVAGEGAPYKTTNEGAYELCFSCHSNYSRVTKEAILGVKAGSKYDWDHWWGVMPPYYTASTQTNFKDRYDNSGKTYDDDMGFRLPGKYFNLHYYHIQDGGGSGWRYRDSINSNIHCLTCHNVHGSNTQWGWVYDEMQYTHHDGQGADKYGTIELPNLNNLNNYPISCALNCHPSAGPLDNWFEPAGE